MTSKAVNKANDTSTTVINNCDKIAPMNVNKSGDDDDDDESNNE